MLQMTTYQRNPLIILSIYYNNTSCIEALVNMLKKE